MASSIIGAAYRTMANTIPQRPGLNVGQAIRDAVALQHQGRLREAEKIYGRVLKLVPNHFDALNLLGTVKLANGQAGEAHRLISAALKVNPNWPDAWVNLGLALHALKRDAEALESFSKALALNPDDMDAVMNSGNALFSLGRADEALACFERVLAAIPQHGDARVARGTALITLKRYAEALADFDAAAAASPSDPVIQYNRGTALLHLCRYADAIAALERALAIKPDYLIALANHGRALQQLNRHMEAIASFRRALALRKDYADAHFQEAQSLMTIGDYRAGFEKYEWRWKRTGMPAQRRNLGRPLWLGEYPLARKTILLHAEQGLGDTIQFVRYVPVLARAGATVIVEVQPELKEALSSLDGAATVIARGDPLPPFDVHCPLASLPLACKTAIDTVPADIPYVRADAARIAKWDARLGALARPRMGVVWSGRATHVNDHNRSIALNSLAPLLAAPGVSFVSLQRDVRDEDVDTLRQSANLTHLGEALDDFADTAAVLSLVDALISVDTSVAHLAAAMGRPVMIMVPFSPDWRWTLDHEQSPWYPNARLFRQPAQGDWDSVVARVRQEIDAMTAS